MADRDYQHSRPLDVHCWSEHTEANKFVDFVRTDTPILTVHDSFIVQIGEEDRLNQLMKEAFNEVTKKARIKVKFNQNLTKTQLYAHRAQDRDWFLDMFQSLFKGSPTNGYQRRLERHREYFRQ